MRVPTRLPMRLPSREEVLESLRSGTWSDDRRRLAGLAVLVATASAAAGVGSGTPVFGVFMYVAITILALFYPAAITGQVLYGQLIVGALILGSGDILAAVVAMAGVVATAELLAVVGRLDSPLPMPPGDAIPRAGWSSGLAAVVFVAVLAIGGLPGPGGPVAVGLAAGASLLVAVKLWRTSGA